MGREIQSPFATRASKKIFVGNATRNRAREKDFQLQKRPIACSGSRDGYPPSRMGDRKRQFSTVKTVVPRKSGGPTKASVVYGSRIHPADRGSNEKNQPAMKNSESVKARHNIDSTTEAHRRRLHMTAASGPATKPAISAVGNASITELMKYAWIEALFTFSDCDLRTAIEAKNQIGIAISVTADAISFMEQDCGAMRVFESLQSDNHVNMPLANGDIPGRYPRYRGPLFTIVGF